MEKIKIEANTVQETLVIPLYARKVCMELFPDLFEDHYANELFDKIDYTYDKKVVPFAALEAGMRQYDLICEIKDYLKDHPKASVVNMGCGLDTTFYLVDNGLINGYNLDLPDVIDARNQLLPPHEREHNVACDLNDISWFKEIDFHEEDGIVFIAGGVFYYFEMQKLQYLFDQMAQYFKGGRLAFDATTALGLKFMMKGYVEKLGIKGVGAFFHVKDLDELRAWSSSFKSVTRKGYMTGYRKPDRSFGLFNRFLSYFGDHTKLTQIIQIEMRS